MYTCKIICIHARYLCIHNHIIFFFKQVKIYVVQWKTYVVMSLQGHRTFGKSTLSRVFCGLRRILSHLSSFESPPQRSPKSAGDRRNPSLRPPDSTPTRGARQRDWLSDWQCGTTLSEEIFLAEKYISCGKNIFLAEKNLFLAEKIYFLRRKIYFLRRKIFLAEKNISCGKKYISCGEKIISCGEKIISCGEKYISCGDKYFLRKKNISCGKIFLNHVTNKLP